VLADAQKAGKIRHIGLSEVDVDTLARARQVVDVVSVQNIYNVGHRGHGDVVAACEADGIGFIPWYPIAGGDLVSRGGTVADLAAQTGYTVAQLSLAWLLRRSAVMLPIPGTGSVAHLEENVAAADVVLTDEQWAALDDLA
jgi:aryl-alcohol dehydrogenase-like predicted oxidoreductase